MTVLHSTKPYGQYLQSFRTDEVTQQNKRYIVSHIRYRKDGNNLTELERSTQEPNGYSDLNVAINQAEKSRKDFLNCAAEEMAGAAEDVRARDYAYETQQPVFPDNFEPFEETSGCNTRIEYLYRDAHNYKQRDTIVVAGVLTEKEQHELREALQSDCFIPEQVGMRPLQADLQAFGPGEDDAWHEIDQISITEETTTFPGTAQELLARFKAADWDPSVSHFEDASPAAGAM